MHAGICVGMLADMYAGMHVDMRVEPLALSDMGMGKVAAGGCPQLSLLDLKGCPKSD